MLQKVLRLQCEYDENNYAQNVRNAHTAHAQLRRFLLRVLECLEERFDVRLLHGVDAIGASVLFAVLRGKMILPNFVDLKTRVSVLTLAGSLQQRSNSRAYKKEFRASVQIS